MVFRTGQASTRSTSSVARSMQVIWSLGAKAVPKSRSFFTHSQDLSLLIGGLDTFCFSWFKFDMFFKLFWNQIKDSPNVGSLTTYVQVLLPDGWGHAARLGKRDFMNLTCFNMCQHRKKTAWFFNMPELNHGWNSGPGWHHCLELLPLYTVNISCWFYFYIFIFYCFGSSRHLLFFEPSNQSSCRTCSHLWNPSGREVLKRRTLFTSYSSSHLGDVSGTW